MYYTIKGHRDETYSLTAKGLYNRIMATSKQSDYNWIASATELVRVCNKPKFPKHYAQEIKLAILNCFANLESKVYDESYRGPTDNDAVYSCFNSLSGTNERIRYVKHKYLKALITTTIENYFEIPVHSGENFHTFCTEWEKAKFEEFCNSKIINFEKFRKYLSSNFEEQITLAENQGLFEEEDREYWEKISKMAVSNFESFT